MAAHFDVDEDDDDLLILRLRNHINNKFHFAAGVMIKLIMKHKYFV